MNQPLTPQHRHFTRRIFASNDLSHRRNALSNLVNEPGYLAYFKAILLPSTPIGSALRGTRFPRNPAGLRINSVVLHSSCLAAVEYTAGLLLPDASRLNEFETFRDVPPALSEPVETPPSSLVATLNAFEERLGFSIWLSSVWMQTHPPGSAELVNRTLKILDANPNAATRFAATYLYQRRSGSYTLSQISDVIGRSELPKEVQHFLSAVLLPTPSFDPDAAKNVLAIAGMCSAIDQWFLLLRCCQALYAAGHESALKNARLLSELLQEVPTVETRHLLRVLFGQQQVEISQPHPLEESLLQASNKSSPPTTDPYIRGHAELFRRTGSESQEEAVGALATLDQMSLQLSPFRPGAFLAANVALLRSLTIHRGQASQRWHSVVAHPDVLSPPNRQACAAISLLDCSESEASLALMVAATDAARDSNWSLVQSILGEDLRTREISALRIESCTRLDLAKPAILAAAVASIEHPTLLHRLPLRQLAELIGDAFPESVEESLAQATILDLCVRHVSPNFAHRRNEAVEDCLEIANVAYPSQLSDEYTSEPASTLLPHFLRTVCIPSILDTIPIGTSTKDLLEERIRVLQTLHERACFDDIGSIQSEIVTISAQLAIMAERQTLDQKRVYVDTEGLSGRLIATLRSDFELYRRYLKIDPRRTQQSSLHRLLTDMFPDMVVLDMNALLRSLTSETDRLLAKMIEQTRDEFAFSNDYGLDGYLSGGIRHGNLEALLRAPFVSAGILGTFSGTSKFVPPSLYTTVCKNLSEAKHDHVQLAFRTFAQDFQSLITEVLAKWVRVETNSSNSDALFDFTIFPEHVRLLEPEASKAASVEDFVASCLAHWWRRVHVSLERARQTIRKDLRARLESVLDRLVTKIYSVDMPLWSTLSVNYIGPTRAQLEIAIETLAGWFQLIESENTEAIAPQLAVDVAQSTVNTLHPRTKIKWTNTLESSHARFTRRSVKHWVDLLLTIFHNIVKHSHQAGGFCADLELSISGTSVSLTVTNPLGEGADPERIDRGIAHVNEQIDQGTYLSAVHFEGRSGLMKVLKTARIDLRAPDSTLTISRHDTTFRVQLTIPNLSCILLQD